MWAVVSEASGVTKYSQVLHQYQYSLG